MIDIIIPVRNEEKILSERFDYFTELRTKAGLIFVDGQSADRTAELSRKLGRVITSPVGRGLQKNAGADAAANEIILFLHADTAITVSALDAIEKAVKEGSLGGCLTMTIDDPMPLFRIWEFMVNARARHFNVFDGDLGFFVRKDVFRQLGKFALLPCMEDIEFSRRLGKKRPFCVLSDKIRVSSRKWREEGFSKTLLTYMLAYVRFRTDTIKPLSIETG